MQGGSRDPAALPCLSHLRSGAREQQRCSQPLPPAGGVSPRQRAAALPHPGESTWLVVLCFSPAGSSPWCLLLRLWACRASSAPLHLLACRADSTASPACSGAGELPLAAGAAHPYPVCHQGPGHAHSGKRQIMCSMHVKRRSKMVNVTCHFMTPMTAVQPSSSLLTSLRRWRPPLCTSAWWARTAPSRWGVLLQTCGAAIPGALLVQKGPLLAL